MRGVASGQLGIGAWGECHLPEQSSIQGEPSDSVATRCKDYCLHHMTRLDQQTSGCNHIRTVIGYEHLLGGQLCELCMYML